MGVLNPLLPKRYAPLQASGAGLQSVYLTRVPEELAAALIDLLGAEAHDLVLGYRVPTDTCPRATELCPSPWMARAAACPLSRRRIRAEAIPRPGGGVSEVRARHLRSRVATRSSRRSVRS